METLARKPTISSKFAPSLPPRTVTTTPLPRLVDMDNSSMAASAAFNRSLQWEVSTELSSRASAMAKSKMANRCPCPCHDDQQQHQTPTTTAATTATASTREATGSSKPTAKADSLGLRHCIRCSLRVTRERYAPLSSSVLTFHPFITGASGRGLCGRV